MIHKPSFRFINYASADAASNMAIDEAILEAHLQSLVPPTLRLYQFTPPAVSLGYAQSLDESLRNRIIACGFDIVRRPTGGRAVLHFGDLTYSFICSSKGASIDEYVLVSESIAAAYKEICQGLIFFLESFGIEVKIGTARNEYKDKHDCFLATTIGDLQYKGKKLVGSAQLRRKHGVLQHGSILLQQPQNLMRELFNGALSDKEHHANLFDITRFEPSIQTLQKEFIKGFQQAFACKFIAKDLTPYEKTSAKKLLSKFRQTVPN